MVTSAFDSAGQRCSALRVLCLQEDVGGSRPRDAEGRDGGAQRWAIRDRLGDRCRAGYYGWRRAIGFLGMSRRCGAGATRCISARCRPRLCMGRSCRRRLSRSKDLSELEGEVFGPVLHVLRYQATGSTAAVEAVNATGYGLTFGVHSRIDETIGRVDRSQRRGQYLRQPQSDRCGGRRAAVRRARAVGDRAQGGRPALPRAGSPSRRRARWMAWKGARRQKPFAPTATGSPSMAMALRPNAAWE